MKSLKKLLVMSICTMFMAGLSLGVHADEKVTYEDPEFTAIGCLTDENGNKYYIEGELVDTPAVFAMDDAGDKTVTYAFDTYATNSELQKGAFDSTGSVKSYILITYNTTGSADEYMLIKRVRGWWTISDPQVSVTSASIKYNCSGLTPHSESVRQTNTINNIVPDKTYNTNFSQYVLKDYSGQINATITTNLKRGSSSKWSFDVGLSIKNI